MKINIKMSATAGKYLIQTTFDSIGEANPL